MPSDRFLHVMNGVHRFVQRITGDRALWTVAGMPVLELTTTGRTSGQPRAVMLTAPLVLDGSWVVVASRGGDPTHPSWYGNLVADPNVMVRTKAGSRDAKARVATPAERADLWPRIIKDHPNYGAYQERTDRSIPVVFLDPVDRAAGV